MKLDINKLTFDEHLDQVLTHPLDDNAPDDTLYPLSFEYKNHMPSDYTVLTCKPVHFSQTRYDDYAPDLFQFLTFEHFIVAGGCFSTLAGGRPEDRDMNADMEYKYDNKHISFAREYIPRDIDIFFYNTTIEDVDRIIKENVERIDDGARHQIKRKDYLNYIIRCKHEKRHPDKIESDFYPKRWDYNIIRTQDTLTYISPTNITYQFMFRLYKTKHDIINGFDLGSSAVGFDGKTRFTTMHGSFAYKYHMNVVDARRASTSYMYRLQKYNDRGFRVLFPHLIINIPLKQVKQMKGIDLYFLNYSVIFRIYAIKGMNENIIEGALHTSNIMDYYDASRATQEAPVFDDVLSDGDKAKIGRLIKKALTKKRYSFHDKKLSAIDPVEWNGNCIEKYYQQRSFQTFKSIENFTDESKIRFLHAKSIGDENTCLDVIGEECKRVSSIVSTKLHWNLDTPTKQGHMSLEPLDVSYKDIYGYYYSEKANK